MWVTLRVKTHGYAQQVAPRRILGRFGSRWFVARILRNVPSPARVGEARKAPYPQPLPTTGGHVSVSLPANECALLEE